MTIIDSVNNNHSVLGKNLLEWIMAPSSVKTDEENEIADKLYTKYVVDRDGNTKKKIFPNVYYYINYNNQFYPDIYMAYIVRDKLKSPRKIPENLANLNIVGSRESYKGSFICEWAYYQNGSSENPFYMDGCDIVTKYLEGRHPLRREVYYFVNHTNKGIKIFRDIHKSPRVEVTKEGRYHG